MVAMKICVVLALIATALANPAPRSFLGTTVEEMRALCSSDDIMACLKYRAVSFLDGIFQQDSYQVSENLEINRNSYRSLETSARSDKDLEAHIEEYVKTHDATFKIPALGTAVTLGTSNLDEDELNLNVKFSTDAQARGKSKIKKIMVPIMILLLIKAVILIPLALGVLGLKAWNSLQLSFFSFVVSIALAVYQLCKKFAADAHPPIAAHGAWDAAAYSHYKRSLDTEEPTNAAHNIAYAAYRQ